MSPTYKTVLFFFFFQHSVATAHFFPFCTMVYICDGRRITHIQTVLVNIGLDSECILNWNLRIRITFVTLNSEGRDIHAYQTFYILKGQTSLHPKCQTLSILKEGWMCCTIMYGRPEYSHGDLPRGSYPIGSGDSNEWSHLERSVPFDYLPCSNTDGIPIL